MLFTKTLILSTLALLTNAQTTTTAAASSTSAASSTLTSAALPTRVVASVEKYLSSISAKPEWSSAIAALTSAIPASVLTEIEDDPTDYLSSILEGSTVPSWFSAVPTSYISYFSSIGAAEASIATAAEGPAPTNAPRVKVVGAALAVGAAGLALL